jgi:hypothetical protein
MQHTSFVTKCQSLKQLKRELLYDLLAMELKKGTNLYQINVNIAALSIQKLFQVRIQVFKHQRQLLFRVDDIMQSDDVWMFEFLQQ